ncbi:MAG TPA: pseudouridine synthase [Candidatus Pelethocola excrementipullorum]|nr:pseudouridine synthase [Candidatus Pelethocola excrementipullorum]
MIRLNKYLSDAGVCSRREGDRMIESGRVSVDGNPAKLGMRISGEEKILVDGKPVKGEASKVYLAYHKPRGIVCTFEKKEKHNLGTAFSYPVRVTYAGRLDKESEGLLLLTNDGEMINQMMRARNYHEKEYVVQVDRELNREFMEGMAGGVFLSELNVKTRPCKVVKSGAREFHITLTQGLNRQIRRMCGEFQYRVTKLKRIRVMNILLGELKPGELRTLTNGELELLKKQLESDRRAEE